MRLLSKDLLMPTEFVFDKIDAKVESTNGKATTKYGRIHIAQNPKTISPYLCLKLELLVIAFVIVTVTATFANAQLSLAGEWRFALDRSDVGVKEEWFNKDLSNQIRLPGALQSQNYGDEISTKTPWVLSLYDRNWFLREDYKAYTKNGEVKVPFLSQPPLHYTGAAWYQRDFEIPQSWQGRRVVLNLERPHWETTVWIDDKKVGSNNSLVAPHVYDLGQLAAGKHRLSIRVDNRLLMPYRPDAHSVSDSLAGSWNGIVGKIEITSTSLVWIDDAQVFPNVEKKSALIKVKMGNASGQSGSGVLSVKDASVPVSWDANGGKAELEVSLGANAQTWDEFHPVLQRLTLQLNISTACAYGRVSSNNQLCRDSRELVFGLSEFKAVGTDFVINGRPTILRGTHHGGDFPLTGYPPTDVEYWIKIFRINKEWGLNHIRFHSFCPPEVAFIAADELGIYLQPEPGMWNEVSPNTPMEKMLYEETERMIKAFGNHPSFVLLSPSNEPKGRWKEAFDKWIAHYRKADSRRLYTNGTGHTEREVPNLAEGADYLVMQRIGPKMLRGNSAWFGGDYRNSLTDINIPVASHEPGQWVAYPDYDIIKKFTGYMRAGNYEIFRDSMAAHGLMEKNKDFAWASGRYQLACYKEEIEANLRTPGLQGFQLLDLHDYLGQGTALVGLLDAFWEEKGYVTAKEFRRFCNRTVPLARLQKYTFTNADKFDVDVEIAHYGETQIENAEAYWKIVDMKGAAVVQGELSKRTIPIGKGIGLGKVSVDLSKLTAPKQYKLAIGIKGTEFENDWNFWLYPAQVNAATPKDIFVTSSWSEAETRLKSGGKVLFIPRNANLDWTSPPLDTVPVFWNRLMGPGWSRMLGLWNDVKHPALSQFPTEANYDWQWMEIIRNVRAINLDKLPRNLKPIVYAIDDWNRNYKLGAIFECKVGKGRLMVSAFDLQSDLEKRFVARQLRRSLLDYMASTKFQPSVVISNEEMRGLFFDTLIMRKLGATVAATQTPVEGNEVSKVIDGDPNSFWQVGGGRNTVQHPYDLTISFPSPVAMSGLVLMPRQNHREHEGDMREFVIQASDDGKNWREVARGSLISTFDPQQVKFGNIISVRYLKLTALSGFGNDNAVALAELAVVYAGQKLKDDVDGNMQYQRSKSATTDIDEGMDVGDKPKPKPTPTPRKP
jgi:hypothetical protein